MADLKEIAAVAKAHGFGLEAINWRQSCYALRFIPALLFLFACLYSIPPYQDTGDDAAIYEGVADSLLHGDGYSLNGQPQVKFPPAFPVTLAALKFVTGSERIYPLAMAGCGAAALLILSVLLIRIEGPVFAFAATSMLAASPAFFSLVTGTTRSDVLSCFLAISACCFFFLFIPRRSVKDLFGFQFLFRTRRLFARPELLLLRRLASIAAAEGCSAHR